MCSVCSVVLFLAGHSGQSQVLRYGVFQIGGASGFAANNRCFLRENLCIKDSIAFFSS